MDKSVILYILLIIAFGSIIFFTVPPAPNGVLSDTKTALFPATFAPHQETALANATGLSPLWTELLKDLLTVSIIGAVLFTSLIVAAYYFNFLLNIRIPSLAHTSSTHRRISGNIIFQKIHDTIHLLLNKTMSATEALLNSNFSKSKSQKLLSKFIK